MRRFAYRYLFLFAALVFCPFAAWSADSPATVESEAALQAVSAISYPAWLNQRLPRHTVAYLRIPSVWGLLSAPRERALDTARRQDEYAQVIAQLRERVYQDPLLDEMALAPVLDLMLSDLSSPIEMAIVSSNGMIGPASSLFVTARLDVAGLDELNARLHDLALLGELPLSLLDAQGRGKIAQGQLGFVQFDAASQRLFVLVGMQPSRAQLDDLIEQTAQTHVSDMAAVERKIDQSGQGLFLWLNARGAKMYAAPFLPQDDAAFLLADFFRKLDSIALGWGTVDGHGRLSLRLHAPAAKVLDYLAPATTPALSPLKTAGAPHWAAMLRLPTAQQWQQLVADLDMLFGKGTQTRFEQLRQQVKADLGLDIVQVLSQIGPAAVGFKDDAGMYSAVQVEDPEALYGLIREVGGQYGVELTQLQPGDATVYHLSIPFDEVSADTAHTADPASAEQPSGPWLKLLSRMKSHMYWVQDGDWLVFGKVPQALADRAASDLDTTLAEWQQAQGYPANSLLGVSAVTHNAVRAGYYTYLQGLRALADILGADVSLAGLPSASELDLPTRGAFGLSLQAGHDVVGLSLQYEMTPLDIVMGGSAKLVVALVGGVVAAVAAPAYEEYVDEAEELLEKQTQP